MNSVPLASKKGAEAFSQGLHALQTSEKKDSPLPPPPALVPPEMVAAAAPVLTLLRSHVAPFGGTR